MKFKIVKISLLIILFLGVLVFTLANSFQMPIITLSPGETLQISRHGECRKVTHTEDTTNEYLVPTRYQHEWLGFINNAGNLNDIVIDECEFDPDDEISACGAAATSTFNYIGEETTVSDLCLEGAPQTIDGSAITQLTLGADPGSGVEWKCVSGEIEAYCSTVRECLTCDHELLAEYNGYADLLDCGWFNAGINHCTQIHCDTEEDEVCAPGPRFTACALGFVTDWEYGCYAKDIGHSQIETDCNPVLQGEIHGDEHGRLGCIYGNVAQSHEDICFNAVPKDNLIPIYQHDYASSGYYHFTVDDDQDSDAISLYAKFENGFLIEVKSCSSGGGSGNECDEYCDEYCQNQNYPQCLMNCGDNCRMYANR